MIVKLNNRVVLSGLVDVHENDIPYIGGEYMGRRMLRREAKANIILQQRRDS